MRVIKQNTVITKTIIGYYDQTKTFTPCFDGFIPNAYKGVAIKMNIPVTALLERGEVIEIIQGEDFENQFKSKRNTKNV